MTAPASTEYTLVFGRHYVATTNQDKKMHESHSKRFVTFSTHRHWNKHLLYGCPTGTNVLF
jgi:hypothetical protein